MALLVASLTSSLLLPRELKNRGTKKEVFEFLKIAHDKFTWNGGEIPYVGRYSGLKWNTLA